MTTHHLLITASELMDCMRYLPPKDAGMEHGKIMCVNLTRRFPPMWNDEMDPKAEITAPPKYTLRFQWNMDALEPAWELITPVFITNAQTIERYTEDHGGTIIEASRPFMETTL
jgi:hypothetical protein